MLEFPGWNPDQKELISLFWKNCFYRHIEEFRKSIKILKGQLDLNRYNQSLVTHLSRLVQEFIAFLQDSTKFINNLMNDVIMLFSSFNYLIYFLLSAPIDNFASQLLREQ